MCSAWSSSRAQSTSSPGCSADFARPYPRLAGPRARAHDVPFPPRSMRYPGRGLAPGRAGSNAFASGSATQSTAPASPAATTTRPPGGSAMKSSRPSWQVSQFPRDGRDQDPNRDLAKRVPLEYSIGWVACTVANMMKAVMVGLPGAAQDRLPASAATGNVCPVLPKPMQVVSRRLGLPRGDAAAGGDGAVREGTQNRPVPGRRGRLPDARNKQPNWGTFECPRRDVRPCRAVVPVCGPVRLGAWRT